MHTCAYYVVHHWHTCYTYLDVSYCACIAIKNTHINAFAAINFPNASIPVFASILHSQFHTCVPVQHTCKSSVAFPLCPQPSSAAWRELTQVTLWPPLSHACVLSSTHNSAIARCCNVLVSTDRTF